MMNSVSSNDLSISATLLENENNNLLCNNNYLPLYVIIISFMVSLIIFGIYYIFFM
jgi:hypothetical protein